MTPIYSLSANGNDITDLIKENFVSLSLKDSIGLDSDTLTIVLDDKNHQIAWPSKDALLRLKLGFNNELFEKGLFIVKELDHSGDPDELVIHCHAADLVRMGKIKFTRHWSNITLGEMVGVIANKYELSAVIDIGIGATPLDDSYQIDETDLNFLARIAEDNEAIIKVKNKKILLLSITTNNDSSTNQINTMPEFEIDRTQVVRPVYLERHDDEYTSVSAKYRYKKCLSFGSYKYCYPVVIKHYKKGSGKTKNLSKIYKDKSAAKSAVESKYNSLVVGSSSLTLPFNHGIPELNCGMKITLTGDFIERIKPIKWIVSEVTHTLSDGLKTTAKLIRSVEYNKLKIKK